MAAFLDIHVHYLDVLAELDSIDRVSEWQNLVCLPKWFASKIMFVL